MAIAAVAAAGCSNSDTVTTSEVALIETYFVSTDDTTIEVWVSVGCAGTRTKVFAVETAEEVKLFAVRNDPDCGSGDRVGAVSSTEVVLGDALGDRDVVDAGCEFVLGKVPCAPRRSTGGPGT